MGRKLERFVHKFSLRPDSGQRAQLEKCFRAAQQVYNACVGEFIRRAKLMKQSKAWQAARAMPKDDDDQIEARNEAFVAVREQYGLDGIYTFHKYARQGEAWDSWIKEHIDSQVARSMARRAYEAGEQWLFGKKGKPKFKSWFQFTSIEGGGIPNGQSIMFDGNNMVFRFNRSDFVVPCAVDRDDPYTQNALEHPIKFSRVIRRKYGDDWRYELQLVLGGQPLNERERGKLTVGVDPGISKFAFVSEEWAYLVDVTAPLQQDDNEVRRLMRKAQRQLQQNNPHCYTGDGQRIEGQKITKRTKGWKKTQSKIREAERCLTEHRKSLHGQVINALIESAAVIVIEHNSYSGFQKNYGKHMRRSAPGEFVARLKRKAGELGVEVVEVSPQGLAPSQFCHGCGAKRKKDLSNRIHECDCGVGPVQRDLYSAWLLRSARLVEQESEDVWVFDTDRLREDWSGAEPRLCQGVVLTPEQFAQAI